MSAAMIYKIEPEGLTVPDSAPPVGWCGTWTHQEHYGEERLILTGYFHRNMIDEGRELVVSRVQNIC
jgi:hypothetical protein